MGSSSLLYSHALCQRDNPLELVRWRHPSVFLDQDALSSRVSFHSASILASYFDPILLSPPQLQQPHLDDQIVVRHQKPISK